MANDSCDSAVGELTLDPLTLDECEEALSDSDGSRGTDSPNTFTKVLSSTRTDLVDGMMGQTADTCSMASYMTTLGDYQVPIVGYEVMEERARFTVYKLRVENKISSDCWYVCRRYTDFVRLCNRLKSTYPHVALHLPRKRILKNNFDPLFLEERQAKLQNLVNAILAEPSLANSADVQDFFCLNEPPSYTETNDESRALLEALEDTVFQLKQQLLEKEATIDRLEDRLHLQGIELENYKKQANAAPLDCAKCRKDEENRTIMLQQ